MKNILKKISYWSFIISLCATPFIFIPINPFPIDVVKLMVLYIGFGLSLATFLMYSISAKQIEIPRSKFFIPIIGLLVASLVSLLMSPAFLTSFVGSGFEQMSFLTIFAYINVMFLTTIHLNSTEKFKSFISFILVSGWFLTIVEFVFLLIGKGAWTLNLTNTKHLFFFATWQSFIVYMGLLFVIGLWYKKYQTEGKLNKKLLMTGLCLQLLFIILGNIFVVNLAIILSILAFAIFSLKTNKENKTPFLKKIMVIEYVFVLFFIAAFIFPAIFVGFKSVTGTSFNEVRPSFKSTAMVGFDAMKNNHMYFGGGPARFGAMWIQNQPKDILLSDFATTEFTNGFSTLSTLAVTLGLLGIIFAILTLFAVLFSLFKLFKKAFKEGNIDAYDLFANIFALYLTVIFAFYVPSTAIVVFIFAALGMLVWVNAKNKSNMVWSMNNSSKVKSTIYHILQYLLMLISVALFIYYLVLAFGIVQTARALKIVNKDGATDKAEQLFLTSAKILHNDLAYGNLADFYNLKLRAITLDTKTDKDTLVEQFRTTFGKVEYWSLQTLSYDPTKSANWQRIGTLYQSVIPFKVKGAYEGSREAYEKLYSLVPYSPEPDVLLARLELANGNKEAVRTLIDKALSKKPNALGLIVFRSNFELEDGNSAEAINWAVKGVTIAPQNPSALFQLAFIQFKTANYNDSLNTIRVLNTVAPNNINVASLLVLVYEKTGKTDEAIKLLEQLELAYPNSKEIKDKLSQLKNGANNSETQATTPEVKKTN